MEVSVRELKAHLSRYLHIVQDGEDIQVTSRQRPVARLTACEAGSGELPSIPGVRWKTQRPGLSKPVSERPVNTGEPLSDWVVANRR